jgi:hypothetical protein
MRLGFGIRRLLLSPKYERPDSGSPRARSGRFGVVAGDRGERRGNTTEQNAARVCSLAHLKMR